MNSVSLEQKNDSDSKDQSKINFGSNHLNSIQQTPSQQPFLDDSILFSNDPFYQFTPVSEIKQNENNFSKLLESNNQSLNNTQQFQDNLVGQRRVQPFDGQSNQSSTSSQQNLDSLDSNINHMAIYCNQSLKSFGYSQLGALVNSRQEDIMQTLNSVYELLQQRQKDIDFRSSIAEKSAKLEQNYKISQEKNEKFQVEIARMKKQIGSLENQIVAAEDKGKRDIQRLTNERDEFSRNLLKLQQKSNQMQNEIRKKESETNRVKEQMKKLTGDKFDKNNIHRNTVDQITLFSNLYQNVNSNAKSWKNNGNEEFIDTINQQSININNKLLSENQSFRNTLIQLNNDLNNFIKQSKDEYVRKKIKEEGSKDESLKEYYQQKLPDIDLIYFKDDCLNLPYERVGAIVVDIFKENFKVVKLFLASISSLLYSHNYYHELGKELDKIKDNLLKIRSTIDVTKILFTERSASLPSYTISGFDGEPQVQQQQNDIKKLNFEITDFKDGRSPSQSNLPSHSPLNSRSQSTSKSTTKGTLAVIGNSNNNSNNSTSNQNVPHNPPKHSSSVRNSSQTRGQGLVSNLNNNEKPKQLAFNKQNSGNIGNGNQNSSALNLVKKDSQNQPKQPQASQAVTTKDEKYFNSSKIEQMIKEKLSAKLKGPLLPSSAEINSQKPTNNNSNNYNPSSSNKMHQHLRDNLLSDRSNLNELESYLQSYQNENFNLNQDQNIANNNNNNDLSLSFVSRVSFRDVPYGNGEIDDKIMEGFGAAQKDMLKGNSDPKQMHLEMKRWQNILSACSSEASLFNSQIEPNTNEQKTQVILKNTPSTGGQQQSQLLTLNGLDINSKQTIPKK